MAHLDSSRLPLLALTLSLALALPAAAVRPDPGDGPELDDAAARMRANEEWRGVSTPEARWRILQEALKERDRYGPPSGGAAPRTAAVTSASIFVNIGPTGADREVNQFTYKEVDSGRARQILTHPTNPGILYLSTSGGGVWKSYDGGGGWEPITDRLGTLSIGALAMDPQSPDTLFLGFGDPFDVQQPGFAKSTDGGITWSAAQQLSTSDYGPTVTASSVRDIKVDPLNSMNVLVATNAGLFVSSDGGSAFNHVKLGSPNNAEVYAEGWSIAYGGPGTWVVTARAVPTNALPRGAGLGIWRVTGSGTTWTGTWAATGLTPANIGRATVVSAAATTWDANASRLFLLTSTLDDMAQENLYRSEDGGQTWTALGVNSTGHPINPNPDAPDLNVIRDQAWYNQALLVDPQDANTVFIGGQLSMVRSTDGGATWAVLSDWLPVQGISRPYVHADFHAFAVGADGTFYAGSDGGLFRSPDPLAACSAGNCGARGGAPASVTFTSTRNVGLTTHLAYSVACAPPSWPAAAATFVAGGLQDNGTRVRSGGSTTFDQVVGGDGIGLAVSANTVTRQNGQPGPADFLTSVPGALYRSNDGGDAFARFTPGGTMPFYVRVTRDTADAKPDTFLTFTASPAAMFKSNPTSVGASWIDVSGQLHWPTKTVSGFVTADGTSSIGLRSVSTHPTKPGFWAAVSNKFAYVTVDGGANWYPSAQPSPGNPATDGAIYLLSSIAFDPDDTSGNTIYAASKAMNLVDGNNNLKPLPTTFGHLYKSTDKGQTWTSLGTSSTGGLPFVPIGVVRFDPANTSVLYAGADIGLYRSTDKGLTWARYGANTGGPDPLGLPLVEVTDLCFSPGNDRIVVSTFGRGFWTIGTDAAGTGTAVRGKGDTDFNQLIDGRDLLDIADMMGANQGSPNYRYQGDLAGTVNLIDDPDLTALLAKLGGTP